MAYCVAPALPQACQPEASRADVMQPGFKAARQRGSEAARQRGSNQGNEASN